MDKPKFWEWAAKGMLQAGKDLLLRTDGPDPDLERTSEEAWDECADEDKDEAVRFSQELAALWLPNVASLNADDRKALGDNLRQMAGDFAYSEPEVGIFGSDALANATNDLADFVEAMGKED